jgi:hypothetical protein
MARKPQNEIAIPLEEKRDAVKRVEAGETKKAIAEEFGVTGQTVANWCKQYGSAQDPSHIGPVAEFVKRVRSVLWRKDKVQYDKWTDEVARLQEKEGFTLEESWVHASKGFPVLKPLFREYDLKQFDKMPESHPNIIHFGDKPRAADIVCENKELSYRECLRWAIAAAGLHLRTGDDPLVIPCDQAYYLYQQAIGEPKDFLAKLGQIESKEDAEASLERATRKAIEHEADAIDKMLQEIEEYESQKEIEGEPVDREEPAARAQELFASFPGEMEEEVPE